ncbi:MAG: cyclic nucleotide-binding domain-containing protein [Desulfobacterales bacterium]|nr:cyclic nucleotide-binding domain-containing protein [Desulfobacterales bacterium]
MGKDLNVNLLDDHIISVLRKFMIFAELSVDEIKDLLSMEAKYKKKIAKICMYGTDEIVINEGDFDCWSFWVVKGRYEVVQAGKLVASFSKPGEIFGEMSVLEGIPRTASVVAKTKGVCLCIDMSVMENFRDSHIADIIRTGFYNVILERLNRSKDKMLEEKQRLELKYADLLDFERRIQEKAGKR